MGLVNYFRDFIPDYATLVAPLEKLRHINLIHDHHQGQAESLSFKSVIAVLHAAPMLSLADFSKQFCVVVDASATGLGAVLYQLKDPDQSDSADNRLYVVFAARALHATERNYSATKRELLAIVFTLRRFHYYIWANISCCSLTIAPYHSC